MYSNKLRSRYSRFLYNNYIILLFSRTIETYSDFCQSKWIAKPTVAHTFQLCCFFSEMLCDIESIRAPNSFKFIQMHFQDFMSYALCQHTIGTLNHPQASEHEHPHYIIVCLLFVVLMFAISIQRHGHAHNIPDANQTSHACSVPFRWLSAAAQNERRVAMFYAIKRKCFHITGRRFVLYANWRLASIIRVCAMFLTALCLRTNPITCSNKVCAQYSVYFEQRF